MKSTFCFLCGFIFFELSAYAADKSCTIRSYTDWYPGGKIYVQPVEEQVETAPNIAKLKVLLDWEDYLLKLPYGKQMSALQFAKSTIDKINQASTKNICSKVPINCGLKFASNLYLGEAYLTYTFETVDPLSKKPFNTLVLGNIQIAGEAAMAKIGFYETRLPLRDSILDQDDVEKKFPVSSLKIVLEGLNQLEKNGICKKTIVPSCKVSWKGQNRASDRVTVNISSALFGEVNMRLDWRYEENDEVKIAIGQKFVESGLCRSVNLAN